MCYLASGLDMQMNGFNATIAAILIVTLGFPARADVLIGLADALSGQLAWTGEQEQRAAEMAVADINAAGGVLGQQVHLIVVDDFCDPKQAVAAARKLVADGVAFVVGHGCSEASIAASPIYEEAGIVQISPSSTNPMLTEQGRANVFRVIGRDDAQGTVAGNYLADRFAGQEIAILHDGTTYGKGLAEETKKQLNKRGFVEAIFKAYDPAKVSFSAEVAMLKAVNSSVVYLGGRSRAAALLARTAGDLGYPLQLISGDTMGTEEFGLIAGAAADGTLFTSHTDPRENREAASVIERMRAENYMSDGFTLPSYAAVQVWAKAVGKAGTLDAGAIISVLRNDEFDTVLGRIDFDYKGDLTVQSWKWYVWKSGHYTPLNEQHR
jgi:branched-chain amino acid transport system substrate-binding protein